jgi:hypothetical protein
MPKNTAPFSVGGRVRIIRGPGRWKRGKLDSIFTKGRYPIYFIVADNGDWYFIKNADDLEASP